VVQELQGLFAERWLAAGADDLSLTFSEPPLPLPCHFPGTLPLPTERVAVSRTQARVGDLDPGSVLEIRHLFVDAILGAQQLIYLENQYFSSQAVYWSLVARMASADRPPIQIVMVLPDRLPFTEELFLGLPQMKLLRSLQQVAAKTGHGIAVFSTACTEDGARTRTFIHSKLLLVDDRFLSVGSANATNRSMGLDTELNVSWEASEHQGELIAAIRGVRSSLLTEHAGLYGRGGERQFLEIEGLTGRLNALADDPGSRLCHYQAEPPPESNELLEALQPIARVVDPEQPIDGEFVFESISSYQTSAFAKGILKLGQKLTGF
jgi:phospholipase D1/2